MESERHAFGEPAHTQIAREHFPPEKGLEIKRRDRRDHHCCL